MICDERINDESEPHIVNILVQFAATHAGEYHSFMISHSVNGATVRPVAVNRLEASLIVAPELEQEFTIRIDPRETARCWPVELTRLASLPLSFHSTSCPFSCRASTRATTNSRSDRRFR